MATQLYKFNGKVKWAKVHTPDEKYDHYVVDAYLDGPSFKLLKASGFQGELREGDIDGETALYVKFRRPVSKMFTNKDTKKKEIKELGAPRVVDATGRALTDLVGNGSDVTLTVSIYDTVKGKGSTLEEVMVRQLVAFDGPNGGAPLEPDYTEPEPKVNKKGRNTQEIIDDEIPF